MHEAGELVWLRINLRNDYRFSTAGDRGGDGEITAVAAHHFDDEGAFVRGGGYAQAIDRVERPLVGTATRTMNRGSVIVDDNQYERLSCWKNPSVPERTYAAFPSGP
jgi:hypothetical protein